ncbi:flagellar hook-length control protein FliK [Ferrimonas balearica]|uniref:flagellar hook-length control protein FliK n=1 Tax=Ferrimonas balearica TaxID=44012 RepID=UPI001C99DC79|nr:flagellar hook-length control protein FliK [Ferrimonas balearica]MBY5991966.1 flagellar hook-length control protein FliK [Ferrimonas balearica]
MQITAMQAPQGRTPTDPITGQPLDGEEGLTEGFGQLMPLTTSQPQPGQPVPVQAVATLPQPGQEGGSRSQPLAPMAATAEAQALSQAQAVEGRPPQVLPRLEAGAPQSPQQAALATQAATVDGVQSTRVTLTPEPMARLGNTALLNPGQSRVALASAEAVAELRPLEAQGSATQAQFQLSQLASPTKPTHQWGPMSLPSEHQHWAREMLSPLRDQLRFQFEQQIKSAELRLDPPELGRIELNVRMEGERLVVQLNAANPTVREALQSGAERLRDELGQHHGGSVDVEVGQEGEGKRSPYEERRAEGVTQVAAAAIGPVEAENHNNLIDALA